VSARLAAIDAVLPAAATHSIRAETAEDRVIAGPA
jgi:hypothetical protein